MGGASYGKPKRKQQAVIEFRCLRNGGETEKREEDEDDNDDEDRKRAGEQVDDGKGGKLKFLSYGPPDEDSKEDRLRLQWDTPYACEDAAQPPEKDPKTSTHWGFFTWMFVM